MLLEAIANTAPEAFDHPYPFGPDLDPAPLFQAWTKDRADGVATSVMAARFHAGLAVAFCTHARSLVESSAAKAIVLSGGCFQNATLLELCCRQLEDLPVLIHTKVPANDGGLALGQALIAAARHLDTDR